MADTIAKRASSRAFEDFASSPAHVAAEHEMHAWRAGRLGYLTVDERFMDLLRAFRLHDAEITEVPAGA